MFQRLAMTAIFIMCLACSAQSLIDGRVNTTRWPGATEIIPLPTVLCPHARRHLRHNVALRLNLVLEFRRERRRVFVERAGFEGGVQEKIRGVDPWERRLPAGLFALLHKHRAEIGCGPTGQDTDSKAPTIVWSAYPKVHGVWETFTSEPIRPATNLAPRAFHRH